MVKNAYFGFLRKNCVNKPKFLFLGVFFGRNQLLRALLDNVRSLKVSSKVDFGKKKNAPKRDFWVFGMEPKNPNIAFSGVFLTYSVLTYSVLALHSDSYI